MKKKASVSKSPLLLPINQKKNSKMNIIAGPANGLNSCLDL